MISRLRQFALVAAITAALTYLFDPRQGRRRRAIARDRIAAFIRRGRRQAGRRRRYLSDKADGLAHQADLSRREKAPADDVTLAHKVETIIFRDPTVPKGRINVGAAGGVVTLRGEADSPGMIRELEQRTAAIPGVRSVENLLHLPRTPAPDKTGTA
jgi:hypothetical protein